MHYFFVKNLFSYDRAIALLVVLKKMAKKHCNQLIYESLTKNFLIYYDKQIIDSTKQNNLKNNDLENVNNPNNINIIKQNIYQSYLKNKHILWPDISVSIYFIQNKNAFYFIFDNLSSYNGLINILLNNKYAQFNILNSQNIDLSGLLELKNDFYEPGLNININFDPFDFLEKNDLTSRAQEQLKIILEEQLIQKNGSISNNDILKIDKKYINSDNQAIEKIKNILIKNNQNINKTNIKNTLK